MQENIDKYIPYTTYTSASTKVGLFSLLHGEKNDKHPYFEVLVHNEKQIVFSKKEVDIIEISRIKFCKSCFTFKLINYFHKAHSKDGYWNDCKDCRNESLNNEIIKNPENIDRECTCCGKTKKLIEFHKKKGGSYGFSTICIKCSSEYNKKNKNKKYLYDKKRLDDKLDEIKFKNKLYYENNKGSISFNSKEYYKKNKKKVLDTCKKWAENNIEKVKEIKTKSYEKHKERYSKEKKEFRKSNPKIVKERKDRYYKENSEEIRKRATLKRKGKEGDEIRRKEREKRSNNVNFRLAKVLRDRIYVAIFGNIKSQHTLDLLGCDLDFFKKYLESKFTNGMSWENYGRKGWQIDHSIPCCKFDLSKEEEQKQCFHYTNLQPMWWKDNISKGGKLIPELAQLKLTL